MAILMSAPGLVLAAGCNKNGNQPFKIADKLFKVNTVCAALIRSGPFGLSEVTSGDVACTGNSSNGSYQWCVGAIENILAQCADDTGGYWDYTSGSHHEYYSCAGFESTESGGKCASSKVKRVKIPDEPITCL